VAISAASISLSADTSCGFAVFIPPSSYLWTKYRCILCMLSVPASLSRAQRFTIKHRSKRVHVCRSGLSRDFPDRGLDRAKIAYAEGVSQDGNVVVGCRCASEDVAALAAKMCSRDPRKPPTASPSDPIRIDIVRDLARRPALGPRADSQSRVAFFSSLLDGL
jgi:hypothetical protein